MLIKSVFNSIFFTWIALAIPGVAMLIALWGGADASGFLHPTGEFSARFMIIAMMLSPLLLIFPHSRVVKWLISRRRALGVAAFCYAVAHTVLYVIDMGNLPQMLDEFWLLGIWPGWFALVIFVPLAFTSNQAMVKKLKFRWKQLQRWVYVAAVLTLVHWIFVHNNVGPALVHFVPLALLECYRVYRLYFFKRRTSLGEQP